MSSKDSIENLILAEKLIETGNENKALFFIDKVIEENFPFFRRFFRESILAKAVKLKIRALNILGRTSEMKDTYTRFPKLSSQSNELLLIYKKLALSENFFVKEILVDYLEKFPFDREITVFFIRNVIDLDIYNRKYLSIFKRYCLMFKKDFKTLEFTIRKIFESGDFDLKFHTIMLNYFYNFTEKDSEFEKNIFLFVEVLINRFTIYKRKIFYPVFRFYYEKKKDNEILRYIFEIISKNGINDEFAREVCEKLLEKDRNNSDILKVLSGIYRTNERKDDKALEIYSRLYDNDPKNFENTKYLAKILRKSNNISSKNIDIFLRAQKLFRENEKDSDEYRNLIEFLGNFLSNEKNYNPEFRFIVEDILRICRNDEVFLYSINFFKYNGEFDKAYFLLGIVRTENLDDMHRIEYYQLYAEVFFSYSFTRNFLDFNWKKVFNYLKLLKKSSRHKAAFLISQYYILKKNRNRLPVCFFTPGACERWSEKCLFMSRINTLKKNMEERELKIIKEYCTLSDNPVSELFSRIFVQDSLYIPIDFSVPMSVCANIQKLVVKDRFSEIYSLFYENQEILDFPGFTFWAGITFYEMKKYDDSILFFTKVINENPSNAYAYYYRGLCFNRKGMFRICSIDFEKVADLKFYNERVLEDIVQIYLSHRYIKEASVIIDILAGIENAQYKASYYKSEILYIRKKYKESLEMLKNLKETDFSEEKTRLLEIRNLYELKEFDKALLKSNKFVEKFSDSKDIYLQRALINIELKNYRLVKKDMEKFGRDIPEKYYYILANASFNTGDIDEAYSYLKKYRERAIFEIKSNLLLSRIYLKKNKGNRALSLLRFTWFFSKNRNVLKELAITSSTIGNKSLAFEYAKKYLSEKGFDADMYMTVLNYAVENNMIHTVSEYIGKYYKKDFKEVDSRLLEIFSKACHITGRFDILAEISENPDENLVRESDQEKIYFIRQVDGMISLKISKGSRVIFQASGLSFSPELFDDNIGMIFYCDLKRDLIGRLRYFSDKVYSLENLFLVFQPWNNPSLVFDEITDIFFSIVEKARDLKPIQKNLVYLTGVFDEFQLEFLDIFPERSQYDINVVKIAENFDQETDMEFLYSPEYSDERKILCNLKLRFWEETLRIRHDLKKTEFYLVCLWQNLGYSYYDDIDQMKKAGNIDSDFVKFFYESIHCPNCSNCSYNCRLNMRDEKIVKSFYYIDVLAENGIDFRINNISEDFTRFLDFERDIADMTEIRELCGIYRSVLEYNQIFYKYDRELYIVYRELIDLSDDLYQKLFYFEKRFDKDRHIIFRPDSVLIGMVEDVMRILENILSHIGKISGIHEEESIRHEFLEFIRSNVSRISGLFAQMLDSSFILILSDSKRLRFYFDIHRQTNKDMLSGYRIENMSFINHFNSIQRVYQLKETVFSEYKDIEEDFLVSKTNILNLIGVLKNERYYFHRFDLRYMLLLNLYLFELTGKRSVIVWKKARLKRNLFYSISDLEENENSATIITDDLRKLDYDERYCNVYFMENMVFSDIPGNLNYNKVFIYTKKEKVRNDNFAFLRFFKNEPEIIKSSALISENNLKYSELEDSGNSVSSFYDNYLGGRIGNYVICKKTDDIELTAFTNNDLSILIKE